MFLRETPRAGRPRDRRRDAGATVKFAGATVVTILEFDDCLLRTAAFFLLLLLLLTFLLIFRLALRTDWQASPHD